MIEVKACARFHLGLLDNNGGQGRLYGSIGLAVSHPLLILRAEKADQLLVEGFETSRVFACAERFFHHFGLPAGARINLISCIPSHVGLGSGTQLALAVGAALARLAGRQISIQEIASVVGRGKHSGIGIATFQRGGFVLDGGHRILSNQPKSTVETEQEKTRIPPVLFQHPVPEDWRFVTIIPETGQGFSGDREDCAFKQLPQSPIGLVEKISWTLLMKMLPALVEKDIVNFGQALTSIQRTVGDCFASVQGGRFGNPMTEKLIQFLLDRGAAGAGQSSWGPTVYGLVEGNDRACKLAEEAQDCLAGLGGGQVFCVQPQNRGAQIRRIVKRPVL